MPVQAQMDIEGSECSAVRGAWAFLQESDIIGMIMEWKFARRDPTCCDVLMRLHDVLETKGLYPYAFRRALRAGKGTGVLGRKPVDKEHICLGGAFGTDLVWRHAHE